MFKISVIICSHNPKINKLKLVLSSLEKQSLDKKDWELIIVDNLSDIKIEKSLNLSWHKNKQVCFEPTLGLTAARLSGISKSLAKYLCFVDDDNLLDKNYLENAYDVLEQKQHIGVIGGYYFPEFEISPPEYAKPYLKLLCVTDKPFEDSFSFDIKKFPDIAGAGMVITRQCALLYKKEIENNTIGLSCGRKGKSLVSGEDTHICLCALRNGFGIGKINSLKLTHLISKERLSKAYLLKMSRDMSYSFLLVNQINGNKNSFKILEYLIGILSSFLKMPFDGAMRRARIYGALKFWAEKLFFK